jgi:hypothetical protein
MRTRSRTRKRKVPTQDSLSQYPKIKIDSEVSARLVPWSHMVKMKEEARKRREIEREFEIPSSKKEFLSIGKGRYKEVLQKRYREIRKKLLEKPQLITGLLKKDPFREALMHNLGVPYSPLLGLYSVTGNILVNLYGKKNEYLVEKLLDYIGKVYKSIHRSASPFLGNPTQLLNLTGEQKSEFGIQEKDEEKVQDWGYHLAKTVGKIPKQALITTDAIERYLFTCVNRAAQKEWIPKEKLNSWRQMEKKKKLGRKPDWKDRFERDNSVDVYTLRSPAKSQESIISEAISNLILEDPIDKILWGNYGKSDQKIADIISIKTQRKMTKQAVQKRRNKNIKPLIEKALEIGVRIPMTDDENRNGYTPRPTSETSFDEVMEGLASGELGYGREKSGGMEMEKMTIQKIKVNLDSED